MAVAAPDLFSPFFGFAQAVLLSSFKEKGYLLQNRAACLILIVCERETFTKRNFKQEDSFPADLFKFHIGMRRKNNCGHIRVTLKIAMNRFEWTYKDIMLRKQIVHVLELPQPRK